MAEITKDTPYPLAGHMTGTQYCEHRKISPSRLSKIISSGRLDGCVVRGFGNRYNIDWKSADKILDMNNHLRERQEKSKRAALGLPPEEEDDPLSDSDDDIDPAKISAFKEKRSPRNVQQFSESQIEAAHYKAKLAKLKYEELEGTLINIEDVKSQTYEMARAIRDSLMELPDRLSAEFAAQRDERKIAIRLDQELRTALERVIKILEEKKEIPL